MQVVVLYYHLLKSNVIGHIFLCVFVKTQFLSFASKVIHVYFQCPIPTMRHACSDGSLLFMSFTCVTCLRIVMLNANTMSAHPSDKENWAFVFALLHL